MKPIKPAPAPLTADQLRIARLFAMMDDRHQQQMIRVAESDATRYPRRARPALRLVSGGDA